MGFLASTKVLCSKDVKVQGCIGQCAPVPNKEGAQFVSSNEIGVGGTNQWYLGGVDRNKSLAIYFDVVSSEARATCSRVYLQF